MAENYEKRIQELENQNAKLVQLACALAYNAGFESGYRRHVGNIMAPSTRHREMVIKTGTNQNDELVFFVPDEKMLNTKLNKMWHPYDWPYGDLAKTGTPEANQGLANMIANAQEDKMNRFIEFTAATAHRKWDAKNID